MESGSQIDLELEEPEMSVAQQIIVGGERGVPDRVMSVGEILSMVGMARGPELKPLSKIQKELPPEGQAAINKSVDKLFREVEAAMTPRALLDVFKADVGEEHYARIGPETFDKLFNKFVDTVRQMEMKKIGDTVVGMLPENHGYSAKEVDEWLHEFDICRGHND